MVSRSNLGSKFNRSDLITVELEDVGQMVSLFIQDNGHNDVSNPQSISDALTEMTRLLEDGFKKEPDKGQLYYALHHALNNMNASIKSAIGSDVAEVELSKHDLELFNISYVQLSEAALQYGGHEEKEKLHPELRQYFSNNAEGHGPEDGKYKAALLRDVVRNGAPRFFEKYPVREVTHEELEFYDAPAPAQRLN